MEQQPRRPIGTAATPLALILAAPTGRRNPSKERR